MATVAQPKRSLFGFRRGSKDAGARRLTKKNPNTLETPVEINTPIEDSDVPVVDDYTLYRRTLPWDDKPVGPYAFPTHDSSSSFTKEISPVQTRPQDFLKPEEVDRKVDLHKDLIDKDTGERKDLTDLMHAMFYDENQHFEDEYEIEANGGIDPHRPRGEPLLTRLSAELWVEITDNLTPHESANLALTCKTALMLLGSAPFERLCFPEHKQERIDFLVRMDIKHPGHLLCFPCATYHKRTHPGSETLKGPGVLNPLFECPNRTNVTLPAPRIRITVGRTLPFTFVQLATRFKRFGPKYGISADTMARKWNDPWSNWKHATRFHVAKNNHLLMRVVSQVWVEGGLMIAAKRMLLYSRDDYTPYFSCCAHWRDGVLMDLCKCALEHVPKPRPRTAYLGGTRPPRQGIITMCSNCQPMRRCPKCPSEYLLELKLVENTDVPRQSPYRFKQALVVTRWCDLGPGTSPQSREWSAIQGEYDGYDSIEETGIRSVSATFESAFTDRYPYQRLLSLNPDKVMKGEDGNDWY